MTLAELAQAQRLEHEQGKPDHDEIHQRGDHKHQVPASEHSPIALQVVNSAPARDGEFRALSADARRDDRWHTNTVDEHADRKP